MTLGEAFERLQEVKPRIKVGKSKFCSLKPKWIKLIAPFDGCACAYHTNPSLMLDSCNQFTGTSTILTEIVVCQTPTESCFSQVF